MPNSYQLHTANGSTTDFSFSQIDGWVSSGFIKVYVDDVLQTTGYTFQNLTAVNPLVRFTTAPVNGKIIKIQRETPSTISGFQSNIVNFNNGSVLTEEDLDNLGRGLLHITQEGNDTGSGALGPTTDGLHWNAESKRIQNIGTPTALTDAATKGYVDGISLYGSAMATPQSWVFNGNGSTTAFTLSPAPATTDAVMFIVEVDGVIQRPTTNYTITAPATLSFFTAPDAGTGNIVVRNFGSTRNVAAFSDAVSFGSNITVAGTVTSTGVISGPGVIPIGGIIMWNGSSASIPSNWQLCDGSNGTPDLRNKFILGGNAYSTSAWRESITGSTLSTGGNKDSIAVSHTHSFSGTADSAGAHTHTVTGSTSNDGAHTHTTTLGVGTTSSTNPPYWQGTGGNTQSSATTSSAGAHTHTLSGTAASAGAHGHTLTGSIASAGSSGTNANLPPFFVLAFIQRMS